MTIYYSNELHIDGLSATAKTQDHRSRQARLREFTHMARATALAVTTDHIRMVELPSSARIRDMLVSGGGEAAAGAFNIGLHKHEDHGGAVIDDDLFATAVAKNAARVDAFKEAATLNDLDRGKFLWQLADKGAGTYAADPKETWVVTFTPSTNFTTTANSFLLELVILEP